MAVYTKKKREDSEEYLARKKALEDLGAAPVYDPGETGIMATEALQEYLNRPQFSYDVNNDVLYNQYADRYTQAGKLAQQNAMGQAAAMTGGYGNSYAQSVGQQAYQGYMQELTDKIPELQQIAYGQYQDRGQEMLQRYGLLADEETKNYARYMDTYNQWAADRDYLTGRVDTQQSLDNTNYWNDVNFEYGAYRDAVNDCRYADETAYNRGRDAVADQRYADETAYNRGRDAVKDAAASSSSTTKKGSEGITYEDYENMSSYVGGLIGDSGNTKNAESYLNWAVTSGNINAMDALNLAYENGIEGYIPPIPNIDTTGWTNSEWEETAMGLASISPEYAEAVLQKYFYDGKIGQGQMSRLLKMVRG